MLFGYIRSLKVTSKMVPNDHLKGIYCHILSARLQTQWQRSHPVQRHIQCTKLINYLTATCVSKWNSACFVIDTIYEIMRSDLRQGTPTIRSLWHRCKDPGPGPPALKHSLLLFGCAEAPCSFSHPRNTMHWWMHIKQMEESKGWQKVTRSSDNTALWGSCLKT